MTISDCLFCLTNTSRPKFIITRRKEKHQILTILKLEPENILYFFLKKLPFCKYCFIHSLILCFYVCSFLSCRLVWVYFAKTKLYGPYVVKKTKG